MNAQVLDFAPSSTRTDEAVFAGTFVQVLGMLLAGHRTGLLVVSSPPHTHRVRFVDGQIVSASSGSPSKLLGEIFVHCGFLALSEVNASLHQANAERRRLGAVLVERGLLSREQVEEGLRLQVRDLLFTALCWRSAAWRFQLDAGVSDPREEVTLRLSTAELILQLVACIDSTEAVGHALGDRDCPVVATKGPGLDLLSATLSSADAYVLSRVDGSLNPREIVNISPLPAAEVERSLLGLLCAGLIAWKPKPSAQGPREEPATPRNHFEVPDLKPPAKPEEPDERSMPHEPPEEALAEAERLLADGRRFEAATSLEDLIPTLGVRQRQRARLLLARAHAGTPSGRRLAETELHEILNQDPGCMEALLLLGTLYRDLGMNRRAVGSFSKALEIVPGHPEAARQLRTLTLAADDTRPLIFPRSA